MLGLSKYFEKKTAFKPIIIAIFQLAFVAVVFILHRIQPSQNNITVAPFLLFVLFNTTVVYLTDFCLAKLGISRSNFHYLPLLFVVNLLVFINNPSPYFIINQIVFITILFTIILMQSEENIRMPLFHIVFSIIVLSFVFYQVIFILLPVFFIILIFSSKTAQNVSVYFASIILSSFFIYSSFYFIWKALNINLFIQLFEKLKNLSLGLNFQASTALIILFFLISISEAIYALKKVNNFRKNFIYMAIVLIIMDMIMFIFISEYTLSFSIPLICYLYGNFIHFRRRQYAKEIFFSGAILLCIIFMYFNF